MLPMRAELLALSPEFDMKEIVRNNNKKHNEGRMNQRSINKRQYL
jgi:hypothetical protein